MRLIALPYAGASANCYHALGRALPSFVKLVAHELPGHGGRMREPLLRRCPALVEDAIERLGPVFASPYAIYGHSFGSWLALDLTRRLIELGHPPPAYLFVSGRRAPSSLDLGPVLHRLPSTAFRARLAELGGTPPAVLADAELMTLFEPILRADLEALETREPSSRPALDVPLHIVVGIEEGINEPQATAWQLETRNRFGLAYLAGDHFAYVRERPLELAVLIARDLCSVLAPREARR